MRPPDGDVDTISEVFVPSNISIPLQDTLVRSQSTERSYGGPLLRGTGYVEQILT